MESVRCFFENQKQDLACRYNGFKDYFDYVVVYELRNTSAPLAVVSKKDNKDIEELVVYAKVIISQTVKDNEKTVKILMIYL